MKTKRFISIFALVVVLCGVAVAYTFAVPVKFTIVHNLGVGGRSDIWDVYADGRVIKYKPQNYRTGLRTVDSIDLSSVRFRVLSPSIYLEVMKLISELKAYDPLDAHIAPPNSDDIGFCLLLIGNDVYCGYDSPGWEAPDSEIVMKIAKLLL